GLAAGVRENQPRHRDRRRRPLARALWHPGVAGSSSGMDRRPAGRVHTPVRMALPADQLTRAADRPGRPLLRASLAVAAPMLTTGDAQALFDAAFGASLAAWPLHRARLQL